MEPKASTKRNPLLGAAVLKATLVLDGGEPAGTQQAGTRQAGREQAGREQAGREQPGKRRAAEQRAIFEDLLVALGVTEEQVDAYARENAAVVADAVAQARGSTRVPATGATKGPARG